MMVTVFCFVLNVGLIDNAESSSLHYEKEANQLHKADILRGTDLGLELERALNRAEGSAMLVRLLGEEVNALKQKNSHPFQDVPKWADDYVGFLYSKGLTQGISTNMFGSLATMTATEYTTFLLRAIGYDDIQGDFKWNEAMLKAVDINMLKHDEVQRMNKKENFLRDDMAGLSWRALHTEIKGKKLILVEKLVQSGALDKKMVFAAGFPVVVSFQEYIAIVDEDQVVAILEDITLSYRELLDLLRVLDIFYPGNADNAVNHSELLANYTRQLVAKKYLTETAKAENVLVDVTIIQEQITINKKRGLVKTVEQEQLLYNYIYDNELINEFFKKMVTDEYFESVVNIEEVKNYYVNNPQDFTHASVRHILISTDQRKESEAVKLANQLAERIRQGEDMGELAYVYTDDPGSKNSGGLYENVLVNQWVREFMEAALISPIGEVGDVVKTDYGYHVLLVENRNVVDFKDVMESIREDIAQEHFRDFMLRAQEHAIINLL